MGEMMNRCQATFTNKKAPDFFKQTNVCSKNNSGALISNLCNKPLSASISRLLFEPKQSGF